MIDRQPVSTDFSLTVKSILPECEYQSQNEFGKVLATRPIPLSSGDIIQFVEADVGRENDKNRTITAFLTSSDGSRIGHLGGRVDGQDICLTNFSFPMILKRLLPDNLRPIFNDSYIRAYEYAIEINSNYRSQHKASELIYLFLKYAQDRNLKSVKVTSEDGSKKILGTSVYEATGAIKNSFNQFEYDVSEVVTRKRQIIDELLKV